MILIFRQVHSQHSKAVASNPLKGCKTAPSIGREWPEYTAQGLQGEEELPLCHHTSVCKPRGEQRYLHSGAAQKPPGWAVPKSGQMVFSGSTRKYAYPLFYERTSGEVLWVIKKHKNLMTGWLTDHILLIPHLNTDFRFSHAESLIKLELRNLTTCACVSVCVHVWRNAHMAH